MKIKKNKKKKWIKDYEYEINNEQIKQKRKEKITQHKLVFVCFHASNVLISDWLKPRIGDCN
jgi:hypothetical protein